MSSLLKPQGKFDIDVIDELLCGTNRTLKIGDYTFSREDDRLVIRSATFRRFEFFYVDGFGQVQPHCPNWLINKRFTAVETAEFARVLTDLESMIAFPGKGLHAD